MQQASAQINWGFSVETSIYEGGWTKHIPYIPTGDFRGFDHKFTLKAGLALEKKLNKNTGLHLNPSFLWGSHSYYSHIPVNNFQAELPLLLMKSLPVQHNSRWLYGIGLSADLNLTKDNKPISEQYNIHPITGEFTSVSFIGLYHQQLIVPAIVLESGFDIGITSRSALYIGLLGHLQLFRSNYLSGEVYSNTGGYFQTLKGDAFSTSYFSLKLAYKFMKGNVGKK
ncbi:hypothetical protein DF182_01020 [Chitinophaga flava]|uniref:Outer membrane protein beta-barrel domain-containing protein n=2 Tax=Chitinophaga flava TaxID=2259036 RepID=A0A365XY13_9BACT|nr:hypothetical protein DF182_01020 [Chitinophaga flava]